ncbi:conserved hypothetical protein [Verticillium alfalfae VaMs.102]|uniref:ZW10 C-terminal helical domain-containing protein n=1 Tax=Verticillium alfalfae (strain VaMs.102 / ATCC MYA-4576 / FGSC 10136) TaxID=526221 RepID=C9SDZ9_VERA1|nr:conserved hypothetical protein [Verticillium alfalfae VaMs.102]EEY17246.1 conserved hypothetical protein [Verticillium alfalfae VaMs.102]
MAVGTEKKTAMQLGDAIVVFALQGEFPDEGVSSLSLAEGDLSPAIEALARAKSQLESEIHTINEETKGDVSSWVRNAKTLQEDILRSKRLADDIVRQSEAPDVSGKTIQDAVDHVDFLRREVQYSQQLHEALTGIRYVNDLLAESWTELDNVPVNKKSCRVMRLLDVRAFELKSAVHKVFDHVWNTLVHVDSETKRLSIYSQRETEQMTLSEAVVGLEAYKEVDDRMSQLWQDIDRAIVSPRMDVRAPQLLAIQASENVLEAQGEAGRTIDDLFADLQKVVEFLAKRLPPDLLIYLSPIMMSDVVPRLVSTWLDAAVPSSLRDIGQFQAVIRSASAFCSALEQNGFSGFTELKEWVGNAPSIWLAKCRETALDAVEKVEKQMVSRSEGKELAANGVAAQADDDDWGAAWGEEDAGQPEPEPEPESHGSLEQSEAKHDAPPEDDGADVWGWDDDDQTAGAGGDGEEAKKGQEDDDDTAAAWGWGDDDGDAAVASTFVPAPAPVPARAPAAAKRAKSTSTAEESREMVLKETYHISSMPDPHRGFSVKPTLALAMFRAVSPHYYAMELGGNMLLYNDAMYLAERLSEVGERWKARDDVTPRARNMLRIDNDVKGLQGFANRAYTGELSTQKTVLGDLVGGEQSLMQQDEMDSCIDSAMARVRSMAVTWESILARSVWYQAVGALVDRLATKIISDVMDMASVGQDEAYKIAQLIAKVTELDDLFLPSRSSSSAATAGGREPTAADAEEIPATAQYASSWLRLKYLSEVLQSNLNEVKYLWCDSELSLYFSADEVVDLIEASFEANARTKETIREIRERPQPVLA